MKKRRHLSAYLLLVCALTNSCMDRSWAKENRVQHSPLRFVHESWDHPDLGRLRDRYEFDEYCSRGNDEFSRMILLRSWVYSRLRYSFSAPFPEMRNSLEILEKAGKGTEFLCSSYAALYMQCALSLGWTSRYLFLRHRGGQLHAAVDIWSNVHKKWVYMDPTWNIHVEKKGEPLSALEIRKEWIVDGGRSLVFVYGSGEKEKRYGYADLPILRNDSVLWRRIPITKEWAAYFHTIGCVGRNDFFSHGDGSGTDIYGTIYVIRDSHNSGAKKGFFSGGTVISPGRLFHELNSCRGRIVYAPDRKGTVRVIFLSLGENFYTPFFDHYQIMGINNEWTDCRDFVDIDPERLNRGIRVRTVNKRGVAGPECLVRQNDEHKTAAP